ncbi:MAG TPA: DUF1631 family protein, partial [Ramlibacter sp.]|nr:DUF1631 family protein [Ramlibacter sp.]
MAAPATQTHYQALYRTCMKEAAAQGRTLMQRLVRRAAMSLPERAAMIRDELEPRLLRDAARTLVKHEGSLCESYPQVLLAEFAQAISGGNRKAGSLSFDSLELMGDEQMQESVDLLRLQQVVLAEVEADLTELNALVCAVQGLRSVQPDRNPLRPEVYVRSVRTVVLQSPVPHAVRHRWMQHLGEALAPELAQVYRELCVVLRAQGVVGAGFNPNTAPEPEAAPARVAVPASKLLNVKELRRLLSGDMDEPGTAPPPHAAPAAGDFSMTMPAAFEALKELKQVDKVMRRMQQLGPAQDDPRLAAQALGQEVVALMVENIAGDTRLLAPVQQAVRELQPALARLAMGDPRFFNDRKHPARRLLEHMTQRSLAWESAAAPGFAAFIEPLQQAVEALLSTQVEGAEPFEFALHSLEEVWSEQQRRDKLHRERAVRALLQAEQRNLLADKIAREMKARPDVSSAPREVATFVAGPWSQVMAQARLLDESGSPDPAGFVALVTDLVWSTQPRSVAINLARLGRLAPELEKKLRHGLATIDYPAPATQRFLDWLASAQKQALQPLAEPGRSPALSGSMTREELEAMLGGDEDTGPAPWLGQTEAQDSGFVHTHSSISPRPLFQETQPGFSDTRPRTAELSPGVREAGVQPGGWVEMMIDGGWGRYQVTWASPHATLYMFANAAG